MREPDNVPLRVPDTLAVRDADFVTEALTERVCEGVPLELGVPLGVGDELRVRVPDAVVDKEAPPEVVADLVLLPLAEFVEDPLTVRVPDLDDVGEMLLLGVAEGVALLLAVSEAGAPKVKEALGVPLGVALFDGVPLGVQGVAPTLA